MKQPNRSMLVFALPLLLALVSLGCGLSGVLASSPDEDNSLPTRTPMPTFTPTPTGDSFLQVTVVADQPQANDPAGQPAEEAAASQASPTPAEPTATPNPSPTPEPVNSPTPEGVQVTIVQNMNVRSGPGTNYPVIGAGPAGESSRVVGRNSDGSWLQVEYPSADGTGWLYAPLVDVAGNPESVAVAQVAPPPAPTQPPQPTEPPPPPPPPEKKYQFTPTGWHASENAAIVHFKGRLRDEAGNLVNGFSVLVDNGAWSVLSHPAGASHHYPDKGDGEWDVVIPNLATGIGWWWLTVVSYDCPHFEVAFNAQCKEFTRLSEDVKIQVNYPEETIINANWICHWDCNKGLYVDAFRRKR